MSEPIVQIIDRSQELEVIKQEFGQHYYMNENAVKKAAAIWGVACNRHGVASETQKEIILSTGSFKGEICFAATTKGYWLTGLSASYATGGFGYAPSVWDKWGFLSYHDAWLAGVIALQNYFNGISQNITRSQHAEMQKALAILTTEKTPQLNLF